jgi:hypothetical protein
VGQAGLSKSKAENDAGNVVLGGGRKVARGFNCLFKKFCHRSIVNLLCPKQLKNTI